MHHVVGSAHKNMGLIVWWERGGLVVGQMDVARSEGMAQRGSHVIFPKRKSCDLPKEEGHSQVMRWNDIVLLLVQAKSREHYVIPAHSLPGKVPKQCPNKAHNRSTCIPGSLAMEHMFSGAVCGLPCCVWCP